MTHESIAQNEAAIHQASRHILAVAAAVETQVQSQPEVDKPHQNDSIANSRPISSIESPTSRGLDPLASLPRPVAPPYPPANRAYTIWQAITAVSELFRPQAIANSDILAVLNKVSGLVQNNVNRVTKYETAVNNIRSHIQKVESSDKWMNWGMAVLGVAFGAAAGFALGGPVGLTAALVVGSSVLLLSNQMSFGGKPIGNWLVDKVSGGTINPGSTSAFGAFDKIVYEGLLKLGLPKGKGGQEAVEGVSQIALGLMVGLTTGCVVSSSTLATVAMDEEGSDLVDAALTAEKAALSKQPAEEVVDLDVDSDSEGEQPSQAQYTEDIAPSRTDSILEEIDASDSETDELQQLERRVERQQDKVEALEKRNPGGVEKHSPSPRKRGFVTGLTQGNQVAQANTKSGNAYADVIEAMGASQESAEWVGFAFAELINLSATLGGLFLGVSPGGDSSQMMTTAMRYISYVEPAVNIISAGANSLVNYNLWKLTQDLKPQKKHLDNADGEVQLMQLGEKSVLGMASTTTNMITKEMDSAVAILNQARQVVQSMFEA